MIYNYDHKFLDKLHVRLGNIDMISNKVSLVRIFKTVSTWNSIPIASFEPF